MPILLRMLSLLALLSVQPLAAEAAWGPLPPDTWRIQAGDPQAPGGAVVLEERLAFNRSNLEWHYRVRIVSKEGMRAASFPAFPVGLLALEGRTIRPDGTVTPFASAKDCRQEPTKPTPYQPIQTLLVPPGVTSDCVVEVYARTETLWFQNNQWMRPLTRPWPIRTFVFSIHSYVDQSWSLQDVGRHRPEISETWTTRTFTFRNLPAEDEGPYVLAPTLDRPTLIFSFNDRLRTPPDGNPDTFWTQVASMLNLFQVKRAVRGDAYKAFSEALRKELPASPQEAARTLLIRAHTRLVNIHERTWETRQRGKDAESSIPSTRPYMAIDIGMLSPRYRVPDLGKMVREGGASAYDWQWLAWNLLADAGLKPRLLGVSNRNAWIFRYSFFNINQITRYLIGIEEPGRETLWLDPTRPLLAPGVIPAPYQGTPGILADLPEEMARPFEVPVQPATANTQTFTYTMAFAEGRQTFDLSAAFLGQEAYLLRFAAKDAAPQGRDQALKDLFAARLKDWTLTGAQVRHHGDVAQPYGWSIQGARPWEAAGALRVHPFPGLASPLEIPDAWPPRRTARIVLPYLQTHRATCRLAIPKGYHVPPQAALEARNAFGSVSWQLKPSSRPEEAEVDLVITTDTLVAPAEDLEAFKAYLGWIQDALARVVTVERDA
ncbi:hypothetical protein [Mesoterricola sediminis]|uniref:DUF3857 domain-containing protein n=1 Tax=Mesoterricola sediminis TaxID=2927980 RepID=A0AA48KEE0_9BACT|nr:hypothetical protein [Mesoterricola sediminis]BDU75368.1 hypothetical protein METESE_03260 [Mesoterricola sediminis]